MLSQPISGPRSPGGTWRINRRLQGVLVVVLVLIFIWIAIDRIWLLRVAAEQTGVEHNLGAMRTALANASIEKVLGTTGLTGLAELNHSNPMALLDPLPANYEVLERTPEFVRLSPSRWYFFADEGVLAYKVGNPEYVRVKNGERPALLRFQVQVAIPSHGSTADGPGNVLLVSLDPYQWLSVD